MKIIDLRSRQRRPRATNNKWKTEHRYLARDSLLSTGEKYNYRNIIEKRAYAFVARGNGFMVAGIQRRDVSRVRTISETILASGKERKRKREEKETRVYRRREWSR